jgi:carboxyl-terminal processing protease
MQGRVRKLRNAAVTAILGAVTAAMPLRAVDSAPQAKTGDGADESLGFDAWRNRPREPYKDGRKNFEAAVAILKNKYQAAGLTDDELYLAATKGLLENVNPADDWDKLLSPAELAELTTNLQGELVGIGVAFEFEPKTGLGLVTQVLPGSTAAAAALHEGDKIITVDGRDFKGKQIRDMVYAIRGRPGQDVALKILRGDQVLAKSLKRAAMKWNVVDVRMLTPHTALIGIHYFTKTTAKDLAAALTALSRHKDVDVIVDLRDNAGGSFEAAMATGSLLLPPGRRIASMVERGGQSKSFVADAAAHALKPSGFTPKRVVVLVNDQTSCGAELIASALKAGYDAPLVGARTFGKWNGQTVETLPNGYAVKFTTMLLRGADGASHDGEGLAPDIEVAMEAARLAAARRLSEPAAKLAADEQLRAAFNLVK